MKVTHHRRFSSQGNLGTFLVFFAVLGLWVGAVPMFGTPDEPAHMRRASSVVHQRHFQRNEANQLVYEVPTILGTDAGCYAFKQEQPADCLDLPADIGTVLAGSATANYPPFFHIVIGIPTLFSSGLTSLYLMRLANALVCAGLLTVALANIRLLKNKGPVAFGLAAALTPMLLFLSGPANPSGIAGTAGLATWTAGLALGDEQVRRPISKSAAMFAIPFCVLLLTRRDSLMWGGLIVIVLAIVIPWSRILTILRVGATWFWAGLCVVTAAGHYVLWGGDQANGFTKAGEAAGNGSASAAFRQLIDYLWQAIGVFGWLDTHMQRIFYIGWLSLLLFLMFGAFAVGRRRHLFALACALGLLFGSVIYIGSIRHPYLQGRYFLPFAVGIPLLAGLSIGDGLTVSVPKRAVGLWFGWIFFLHQLAFVQQLRRHSVGAHGSWGFVFDHQWSPTPGPIWLFVSAYALGCAAMLKMIADVADYPSDSKLSPAPES